MHTDIAKDHPTSDDINTGAVGNGTDTNKAFTGLQAALGDIAHRTLAEGGAETFWAERWGLVRYLPAIDKVRQVLDQIGGRI